MSKASQLATRDKNTAQRLVDLVSAHDRAVTQSTAQAVADAMWRYFDQDRILIKGGECNDGVTYCQVGNAVLKVCSQSISGALSYNVARNVVSCSRDRVTVSIAPATEAELLDALETAKGSARLRIQEFLRIVRDEPAPPLEIRVVNADQIGKIGKALKVSRDSDGKLTGAVIAPIE